MLSTAQTFVWAASREAGFGISYDNLGNKTIFVYLSVESGDITQKVTSAFSFFMGKVLLVVTCNYPFIQLVILKDERANTTTFCSFLLRLNNTCKGPRISPKQFHYEKKDLVYLKSVHFSSRAF